MQELSTGKSSLTEEEKQKICDLAFKLVIGEVPIYKGVSDTEQEELPQSPLDRVTTEQADTLLLNLIFGKQSSDQLKTEGEQSHSKDDQNGT